MVFVKPNKKKQNLSDKERLELAKARADQAGLPAEEQPILERGEITTGEQKVKEEKTAAEIVKAKRAAEAQEFMAGRQPVELPPEAPPPTAPGREFFGDILPPGAENLQAGAISQPIAREDVGESLKVGAISAAALAILIGGIAVGAEALALHGARTAITTKIATNTAARTAAVSGLATKLKSWALALTVGTVAYAGAGIVKKSTVERGDRILRSIESEVALMSEEIPDPIRAAAIGAYEGGPLAAYEELEAIELSLLELEQAMQEARIHSIEARTNPQFLGPLERRIAKQQRKIKVGKTIISEIIVSGVLPDPELIAMMFQDVVGETE